MPSKSTWHRSRQEQKRQHRKDRTDKKEKSMLLHQLIHPKINEVIGRAGHHGKILIADGNYPASSTLGPNAELVSLNLSPGLVTCDQVLRALVTAIPIEEANTMNYETEGPYALSEDPPVWDQYRATFKDAKTRPRPEANREVGLLRGREHT